MVTSLASNDDPPSGASVNVARTVKAVAFVAEVPVADGVDESETPAEVSIVAVIESLAGEELPAASI